MRAILINAKNRTITEVDTVGDLYSMRELLGCKTIEAPYELENGDTVYCDDEGLYNNRDFVELIPEYDPIAGNVLILGFNRNTYDNTDCLSNIADIQDTATFYDIATLQLKYRLMGS